jgi:hypothetical protein
MSSTETNEKDTDHSSNAAKLETELVSNGEEVPPPAAAAAAATTARLNNNILHDIDIGRILKEEGKIVKCVLLKHIRDDGKDAKPPHATTTQNKRVVLTDLIQEIELDTTPSKSQVAHVLGGPFTFLGQYADEGTIVMCRRPMLPDDDATVLQLLQRCHDFGISTDSVTEKQQLMDLLEQGRLPVNPHVLQPPFDKDRVEGDILILRVADTEDDEQPEEFFLDYTKDEYVAFASRTDVVAPELPVHESSEEESEEEEDNADDDEEDNEGTS